MSQIYLLGREDSDGLARLNRRPLLTFDDEVGGWDTMCSNDETYLGLPPTTLAKHEPALHVFDSRIEDRQEESKYERPEEAPWPTITYQTRFGEDQ